MSDCLFILRREAPHLDAAAGQSHRFQEPNADRRVGKLPRSDVRLSRREAR